MNEEIFDIISGLLAKSGATVSKKMDGTITVSLPDSDEYLAECTDNGDGTVSYTMHLGDGADETGNGTPEDFRDHVLDALDSWIDLFPYDNTSIEPTISQEYRRAIGESRDDAMRRALFEMGLNDDQSDAIMEVASVLFESSMVTVKINGRDVTGSSLDNLVSRKENQPFLIRQWALSKLGKNPSDKTTPTAELIAQLGGKKPSKDELREFVNGFLYSMSKERVFTDDDVLGTAWNQFDRSSVEKSTAASGRNKSITAVLDSETPIESGERDDYDEEIEPVESHAGNASTPAPTGGETSETEETAEQNDVGSAVDTGKDISEQEKDLSEQLGVNVSIDGGDSEDAGTAETPNDEKTMSSLWDGDASVLANVQVDDKYDLPMGAIEEVEEKTKQMKESFNDILQAIPTIPSRSVSMVLQMIFGKVGGGLRGAVLRIINGDQATLGKIETGEGILGADKATQAQRDELNGAIGTELVQSAIKRIQDEFSDYAEFIEKILPDAYDEACGVERDSAQSVGGDIGAVEDDFVKLFRAILFDKKCPFAAYPWTVVEKLTSNLADVFRLSTNHAASRNVSTAATAKTMTTL